MTQCPDCADDIPSDSIFCPYCGIRIRETRARSAPARPAPRQKAWIIAFTAISAALVIVSLGVAFAVERANHRRNQMREMQRDQEAFSRKFDELLQRQFGRSQGGRSR